MRLFRWPWPLFSSSPYCCPIWKVKSLQSLPLALLSPMERGSSSMPGEGIGSPLLLFELSKGEPGGSSIRAIACYFAALPLIAF